MMSHNTYSGSFMWTAATSPIKRLLYRKTALRVVPQKSNLRICALCLLRCLDPRASVALLFAVFPAQGRVRKCRRERLHRSVCPLLGWFRR